MPDWTSQQPYRCRLEWGRRGARAAAERGDILVVVDTLSFSTAVATAIHHGGIVYPCAAGEDAARLAERAHAELAVPRKDVPEKGRFSLSPGTFERIEPGTRAMLPSPNGATCACHAADVAHLFVGALVNAKAVAAAVSRTMQTTGLDVTVLACGERWPTDNEDERLRFAIEDYLAAGAILSHIRYSKSPEARVCKAAFNEGVRLFEILWDCGSGRELREKGFPDDVQRAAQLDRFDSVPAMRDGRFERWHPDWLKRGARKSRTAHSAR